MTYQTDPGIRVSINAPSDEKFNPKLPVCLTFYALPNGSSIEETIGKRITGKDENRYDIQHIGAQARYIRNLNPGYNLVVIYLENELKSWTAWKAQYQNHAEIIFQVTEKVRQRFSNYENYTVLNGHSGGGRLIFSYLDQFDDIPAHVKRIAFLDSNYGYEHEYGPKLTRWLQQSEQHRLLVLAYNDSVALYKGKTFVSPTGGTWYRSKMMLRDLKQHFRFTHNENDSMIRSSSPKNQIQFILKKNPDRKIFHTEQVEYNGFIHSMLTGTPEEEKNYRYFGNRVYDRFIQKEEDTLATDHQ